MRRRRLLIQLLVALLATAMGIVLLVSCGGVPSEATSPASTGGVKVQEVSSIYGVRRVTDREAGVVCWLVYSEGISCLPISETLLEE